MGYEILTCQMQYDAADKKTDQEDPCTLEGTDHENVESIKYLGVTITSAGFEMEYTCKQYLH